MNRQAIAGELKSLGEEEIDDCCSSSFYIIDDDWSHVLVRMHSLLHLSYTFMGKLWTYKLDAIRLDYAFYGMVKL